MFSLSLLLCRYVRTFHPYACTCTRTYVCTYIHMHAYVSALVVAMCICVYSYVSPACSAVSIDAVFIHSPLSLLFSAQHSLVCLYILAILYMSVYVYGIGRSHTYICTYVVALLMAMYCVAVLMPVCTWRCVGERSVRNVVFGNSSLPQSPLHYLILHHHLFCSPSLPLPHSLPEEHYSPPVGQGLLLS